MEKAAALLLAMVVCAGCGAGSDIKPSEEVLFFPTFAYEEPATPGPRCVVDIHAWVYEPVQGSLNRRALLALLRESLDLEKGEADTERFNARARWFLVDSVEDKSPRVRLGGEVYELAGRSDETGHLRGRLAGELKLDTGWTRFEAVVPAGDKRKFTGDVLVLRREGVSVISDIDDTIKVSNVRDKRALVANTFLKEYEPVEGMADLYQVLAEKGAAFHYLSASPWQLYPPLREFLDAKKFPLGTFHMHDFSLGHSEFFDLFESTEKWKPTQIEPMMEKLPGRTFLLIGDSGEKDPEIYGAIARKYPGRIAGIFIHNVTGAAADAERYANAFKGMPRDRWAVFDDPAQIRDRALRLVK